jgi:superfamily I DNA/RNA helicase
MEEVKSNICFVSNTYKVDMPFSKKMKSYQKGDTNFLRQIHDYDALMKLYEYMGHSCNAGYYTWRKSQIDIIDPQFQSVMVQTRKNDPLIEEDNWINDALYGYDNLDHSKLYPLIDEILFEESEDVSIEERQLGQWIKTSRANGSEESGTYVFEKVISSIADKKVSIKSAGLEKVQDNDPYYYMYREESGEQGDNINIDKAKLYVKKYGSMFAAFEDVEQTDIITTNYDDRIFLNAGPGTGKTYTILHKLENLVAKQDVDPESIMVLCFTNAAVKEIKDRMMRFADQTGEWSLNNIDARTFHSFSWWLIAQANELFVGKNSYQFIDFTKLDYDASICAAIRIIKKFGDDIFVGWSHFIVDEIQDLTDERARMVLAMIEECIKHGVGITVCGDSCQAIYDYTQDDEKSQMGSSEFYMQLFSLLYDNAKFCSLLYNHRQTSELKALSIKFRDAILEENFEKMKKEVRSIYNRITDLGVNFSVKASRNIFDMLLEDGTACLMCRNNAQVLQVSANLRKRGIEHVVNAYEDSKYYADWIGKVFSDYKEDSISYNTFWNQFIEKHIELNPEATWNRLCDIVGDDNNVLVVKHVIEAIKNASFDDPILRNVQKKGLIVSNIHKAKGREYDTVVLERKFVKRLIDKQENIGEYKTLYVGITRPKKKLLFASLATVNVSLREIYKTGRKRWIRGDWPYLKKIEIRGISDVEVLSFNEESIQRYIASKVKIGDEIELRKSSAEKANYDIYHMHNGIGTRIGNVSKELLEDIDATISPYKSPWPIVISELYVSGIHTEISMNNDVWCWADFCGLGTCEYDVY